MTEDYLDYNHITSEQIREEYELARKILCFYFMNGINIRDRGPEFRDQYEEFGKSFSLISMVISAIITNYRDIPRVSDEVYEWVNSELSEGALNVWGR